MKQPTLRLLRSLILAAWPCAALAAPLDLDLPRQPLQLWPGASLALAVNNATDRRYSSQVTFSERGFATEEAGRNVRLTLGMAF